MFAREPAAGHTRLPFLPCAAPMPTLWKWNFCEGVATKGRGGDQRSYAGDNVVVVEPDLGVCTLDRIEGAGESAIMYVKHTSGESFEIEDVVSSNVYAVANRPERLDPAKTGRRGAGHVANIATMFGPATPTLVDGQVGGGQGRGSGRGGRGSGRGGAFAKKRPAARGSSAPPASRQRTAEEAEEPPTEAVKTVQTLLGAEYADMSDEDGQAPAPAPAEQPKVQFSKKSAEEKAAYKAAQYQARKDKHQDDWFVTYGSWLAKDALRGAHCKFCITSTVKAADKLSSTGYGFIGEGAERTLVPIPTEQKLKEHAARDQHKYNVRQATEEVAGEQPRGSVHNFCTVTSEEELYFRTIRTIHNVVIRLNSLNDVVSLLQLQNANGQVVSFDHVDCGHGSSDGGGVATWLQAGANVFQAQQRERAQPTLMRVLFSRGVPFGLMGDGSNDRSLVEQEAVVLRFIGDDGKPYNTFFDLASLDLSTSADGRSPDADCIASCYAGSMSELNKYEGFLHLSDWKKSLVGCSFDGASVMLGEFNGVAKKLADMTDGHLVIVHAVAHVQQLANGDAFSDVEYYEEWRSTMQEVYVHYHASGKKRFSLEAVANEIGTSLLKFATTHGIRWAAAQQNTIKAMSTDVPAVVVDLEVTVKRELNMNYTQLTASNLFLKKTFTQEFAPTTAGARPSRWKATVKDFTASDDGIAANDMFAVGYKDGTKIEMSKTELVSKLTDLNNEKLTGDSRWKLREKLTEWRFNAFTAFMLDVHAQLAILSKSFQSNGLTPFDIAKNLNKTLRELEKIKAAPRTAEKAFLEQMAKNSDANCLEGSCQLYGRDEGEPEYKKDRDNITDGLTEHLTNRFKKVLSDPVLMATAVFDHRKWPGTDDLEDFGAPEIKLLFSKYKCFYLESDTEADVLEQWEDVKGEITRAPGLRTLSFHDLWARMLTMWSDEYPLVMRLVVIMLLIPCDTSECERVFSLMNDLKTAERSRLGQTNLRNLMIWHAIAKKVSYVELPVVAILER